MSNPHTGVFSRPSSQPLVFITALVVYGLLQYAISPSFFFDYTPKDADDGMRLLAARDLLNGQGWFDTHQYRVLPPDGLLLHWSRVIDAALAGLMWCFGLFLPQHLAERAAAAVWPAALFVVYLLTCFRAARAAGGNSAASFAMLAAAALLVLSVAFFSLGRVDHHNVQLIAMVFVCGAVLSQGDARKVGMIGGAVAGFSLAVGLETLPFIVLAGLIMVIEFCIRRPVAHDRLLAFGIGLAASATAFFYLQTPPGSYGALRCDTLGIPMLFLPVGAGVYTFLLCLLGRPLATAGARFGLAIFLALIWVALIWLPFQPCAEGPYANVDPAIREMVISQVIENHSALMIWQENLGRALVQFLPVILLTLLLIPGAIWRKSRAHRILLAFMLLGILGSFIQLRLMVWAVALMPVVFGVVISDLINRPWPRLWLLKPVVILPLTLLILVPPLALWLLSLVLGDRIPASTATGQMDQACNTRAQLQELNGVPPGLFLNPLNLGAPVLYNSHHSVTSVPYHRSPTALISGMAPFQGDAAQLLAAADELGATHVIVCRDQNYWGDDTAASRLARGEEIDGLVEVALPDTRLRLLARQ